LPLAARRVLATGPGRVATARRRRRARPAGAPRDGADRPPVAVPGPRGAGRRGPPRAGRRVDREAVLQRAAPAADRLRHRGRGARRPRAPGQAAVERLGVGGLDARLPGVVGVDHPGRFERDPADDHRRARAEPAPGAVGPVNSPLADLHDDLRAVAQDLLAGTSPLAAGGEPVAPEWALLAEAGWLGLEVPERLGGAGATFAEVAVVLE